MLFVHRTFGILAALLILFIAVTGVLTEMVDLRAIVLKYPATNPDVLFMRESIDGPSNFVVVTPADYTAQTLPGALNINAAMTKVVNAARASAPHAALRLVELQMDNGQVVGHVQLDQQRFAFSASTGAPLPYNYQPQRHVQSTREAVKNYHRFIPINRAWGMILSVLGGMVMAVLVFTGLVQYFRMLSGRSKLGRNAMFWSGGGWWRSLHRWLSIGLSIPIVILTVTGFLLAVDCLGQPIHGLLHPSHPGGPNPFADDMSSPMTNAELPTMLRTTLLSYQQVMPNMPIKVVRLRYFSGMPQGVVIAGDADTSQLVFNAVTGKQVSESEPGYPDTGYPFGWQWHQWLKKIHRGDMIVGVSGRWVELLGGLGIVYLSFSAFIMYYNLWARRRRNGRTALMWH